MRRDLALAFCLCLATPAVADVAETVTDHILPGYARFSDSAAALGAAAQADCRPAALRGLWNAAFDGWMGVSHLRLGPVEEQGRALAIAYWPDPKATGARQLAGVLAAADPALLEPGAMAEASVALRGLFGLERVLYGPDYAEGSYACGLARALAGDLANTAGAVAAGWGTPGGGGYADALLAAGAAGNASFLDAREARQALFTQLITGLDFIADQRLGRPLGSFDRPQPARAETLLSGRPLRNVALSLAALREMAQTLAPEAAATQAALGRAITLAEKLPDPTLAGVADPSGWLKVEILQQAVHAARDTAVAEIGAALGVGLGFNAADGD